MEKKKGGGGKEGWTCNIERETFMRGFICIYLYLHFYLYVCNEDLRWNFILQSNTRSERL